MIYFRALVVLATTFSALASPLMQRTVAQVEADINAIGTQVTTLNNQITAFPNTGGSIANALAIHEQAGTLESAINQGTTDVKNTGAVSEADATTILHLVQGIEGTIISALNAIAGKRAAFDSLPLGGVSALVKTDLNTLNTDTTAFENALIAAAPADLKPNATAIQTAISAAFSTAIAAYASA